MNIIKKLRHFCSPLKRRYRKYLLRLYRKHHQLRIMNREDTLEKIINENLSVSRFGDGEFLMVLDHTKSLGLQKSDEALSEALHKIFYSDCKSLLICLPSSLLSTKMMTEKAADFWNSFNTDYYKSVYRLLKSSPLSESYVFGDSLLTRPYMDLSPSYKKGSFCYFEKLKKLWDNKDILIAEGEKTKLGVGNDLFSGAASIKRIICPSSNAFDSYSTILNSIVRSCVGRLVLISLGPTATVLAAELAEKGIQAIDIGHIDIEYCWMLEKADEKQPVKGKYVNETVFQFTEDETEDREYLSQIIERI